MGASPSSLALGALGALFAAQAGVAAFAPQAFASLLGAPAPSPAMSRMLAACFATFGVLFAHFIPYSDKHQGGLRTAQMLSFLLALAGATDGFFAPDASPDAQAAGRRVAVLHAAATALATYAVRFAEKRKSAD